MPAAQTVQHVYTEYDLILALLDWPFLLFVFFLFFALIFRVKIVGLLERGDIQVSWGDRHIKLKELSDGIDGEIDPIREELQEMREKIEKLCPDSAEEIASTFVQGKLDDTQRKEAAFKILDGLKNSRYRWRSVERLALESGMSESDTLDILRADPKVLLSIGKSRREIARLKDR